MSDAAVGAVEPASRRELLLPLLVGGVVVAFFVVLYPALGLRVPIGSDSPVYVWWARYAGAAGFGQLETGTRPAVIGLLASLAGLTRVQTATVVEALGPVLAAALALATAVFAKASGRHPRPRLAFVLVGILVGVFLGFVVPGYLSTLAFLAPFLAGLAVVTTAAGRAGHGPFLAAGLLFATAGLSHPLFLALAGGISAGIALALIPSFALARRRGLPLATTALGRLALSWTLAVPVVGLGLAASGVGTGTGVDTSRDAVLRRTGLGALLKDSYTRKLHHDVPWWRAAAMIGPALTALPLLPGRAESEAPLATGDEDGPAERERSAAFWGGMATWLLITLVGVTLLILGRAAAPGQRLIVVCLPLPILAGLGLAAVRARSRWITVTAIAVGSAVFVAAVGSAWLANRPLSTAAQIEQARAAGAALAATRPTTPLVVVIDDRTDKPGLFVTRYENDLRGAVPAGRVPDVHVFVGPPADLLAHRATVTGQPEHDRLALGYWLQIRKLLHRQPLVVVVQGFDRRSFDAVSSMPGCTLIAPGVVALPGFGPPAAAALNLPRSLTEPGAGPVSPWAPLWLAPLLLVAFAALGWPWGRSALPEASVVDVVALAPAFGVAALSLGAVAADAAGLRLTGPGAFVAFALALAGWGLVAVRRLRRTPTGGRADGRSVRVTASARTPGSPGPAGADPGPAGPG